MPSTELMLIVLIGAGLIGGSVLNKWWACVPLTLVGAVLYVGFTDSWYELAEEDKVSWTVFCGLIAGGSAELVVLSRRLGRRVKRTLGGAGA